METSPANPFFVRVNNAFGTCIKVPKIIKAKEICYEKIFGCRNYSSNYTCLGSGNLQSRRKTKCNDCCMGRSMLFKATMCLCISKKSHVYLQQYCGTKSVYSKYSVRKLYQGG